MPPNPESPHREHPLPVTGSPPAAVHWLADAAALAAAAAQWRRCAVLGVDTEFFRERTYYPRLGLIQLSDGESVWLIDAPAIEDWTPLTEVIFAAGMIKVMHAAREDLEVLRLTLGTVPLPLFDTQIAAALCGHPPSLSYGALVETVLGIRLAKAHARSDWLHRPLPPALIEYAALDVLYLPALWRHLEAGLQALDRRTWLDDEMQTLASEAGTADLLNAHFRRLPGLAEAGPEAQAIAFSLCQWRDRTARRLDLPRSFVLRDEGLMALASAAPRTLAEIEALPVLHRKQAQRYGRQWLECIAGAAAGSAPDIHRPDSEFRRRTRDWQKRVKEKAAALNLHPTVLLSRRDIERLLLNGPESLPGGRGGWRHRLLAGDLAALGND